MFGFFKDRVFLSDNAIRHLESGVGQDFTHVYHSLGAHGFPSIEASHLFWRQAMEALSLAESIGGETGSRAGTIRKTILRATQNRDW